MQQHKTATYTMLVGLLISMALLLTRQATAQLVDCPPPGQDLIKIPEIKSQNGRLRAEIAVTSGTKRTLWGSKGDTRCVSQDLRYLTGRNMLTPGPEDPAFAKGEPIPGPTLRARVGDLIQIKFQNLVDTQAFVNSLDAASTNPTNTTGCDEVYSNGGQRYPGVGGDVYPNCLHGDSTSNLHFHGTHTTPNTTGDNILLFVRPALRSGPDRKIIGPNDADVNTSFAKIFDACEQNGSPTNWGQIPEEWRTIQENLLKQYDATAPYKGQPGPLPLASQLWPANAWQINSNPSVWPQYQIGAFPYCFQLADAKKNKMGQAPGTHWYHAHKHGSTALNVANGMTGAFVIEGQYDDDLRKFYGEGFRDQVLVIQQLSSTPFAVLNPSPTTGGSGRNRNSEGRKPQLSVNGRLNPVVKMRPGEVQLWRLVNGAFRDAVLLQSFKPQGGLAWRQIAQDGVQLAFANYGTMGSVNRPINLAPANRADLLVKAPITEGRYALMVQPNAGLPLDDKSGINPENPITLLTVSVEGQPVSPAQDFIQKESDFPTFPQYLADINKLLLDTQKTREVAFGAGHNQIDGKSFDGSVYNQTMQLNTAEEWKITNAANDKAHPFHIHVNPFQITEVFEPNAADTNTTDPKKPCYVNPLDPTTWKPCAPLPAPYVWWDTFAIPTARQFTLEDETCTGDVTRCPKQIQPYVQCSTRQQEKNGPWKTTCTLTIPGYFKMRSRFVDFTGTYVVHCHILIHEDRGMMQLVRVIDGPVTNNSPPYVHH